jgi:hypothetical protein
MIRAAFIQKLYHNYLSCYMTLVTDSGFQLTAINK